MIVYDSLYGNTEKIAVAIQEGIGGEAVLLRADRAAPAALPPFDLLIVGAPTQGGRPTRPVQGFLDGLPAMKGARVAAFDTRIPAAWVKIFGFAAGKIERALKDKGGVPAAKAEGFYVNGTKGPLKDGETERARVWAKGLISKAG